MFGNFDNPLAKVTEFFEETNPELDQIKESVIGKLDDLKRSENFESLEANMRTVALKGFEKDLNELSISNEQKKQLIGVFNERWVEMMQPEEIEAIMKSPEKAALDAFVSDLSNLPILKEMIESAEPKAKWKMWFDGIDDKIKKMFVTVGGFMGIGVETDPKKQGIFDRIFNYIKGAPEAAVVAGAGVAATGAAATAPESTAAANQGKEAQELPPAHLAAIKPLEDIGITINRSTVTADMNFFEQNNVDALELSKKAAKGNLKDIFLAMKTALGDNISQVQFELKDAFVFDQKEETSTPEHKDAVLAAIANIQQATPTKMREFLSSDAKTMNSTALAKKYASEESSEANG